MSDITLSSAVRSNLLSLQNTADMMATTQNRLATGKKVNSALDNPTNFFTASSLNSRAGDINQLLDGMANGIQTLEAADNGLKAITKTLESMQSTLRQARQDKSFQTISLSMPGANGATPTGSEVLELSGGAFGEGVSATIALTEMVQENQPATNAEVVGTTTLGPLAPDGANQTFTINGETIEFTDGTTYEPQDIVDHINTTLAGTPAAHIVADLDAQGRLTLTSTGAPGVSDEIVVAGDLTGLGITAETTTGSDAVTGTPTPAWKDVNAIVNSINGDSSLNTSIRASNDNGRLRIENLSTGTLTIDGADADGQIDGSSRGASTVGGNTVRAGLADQFRELRDQLDKLVDDASFNGINLLRGDNLQITFNETGTSELNIQSRINGVAGASLNAGTLGIPTNMQAADLNSDSSIDGFLSSVKEAINTVRSQASAFGSSLSVVQNRQDFSKNMINTLETGAANLTLADSNEEAANLLALQTRQQLSSTALSMASQQDQSVLRLF